MRLTFAALAVLLAGPARAHDGRHETLALQEQLRHLLGEPDHLLAAAGLAVLAIAGGWAWRRASGARSS